MAKNRCCYCQISKEFFFVLKFNKTRTNFPVRRSKANEKLSKKKDRQIYSLAKKYECNCNVTNTKTYFLYFTLL